MKAYPLPAMLCCGVCGGAMQTHGQVVDGAVVVTCVSECAEKDVRRKYQVAPVELDTLPSETPV